MTRYATLKGYKMVWEVTVENKDGSFDLSIDDIQGDTTYCFNPKEDVTFVDESVYKERIKERQKFLDSI